MSAWSEYLEEVAFSVTKDLLKGKKVTMSYDKNKLSLKQDKILVEDIPFLLHKIREQCKGLNLNSLIQTEVDEVRFITCLLTVPDTCYFQGKPYYRNYHNKGKVCKMSTPTEPMYLCGKYIPYTIPRNQECITLKDFFKLLPHVHDNIWKYGTLPEYLKQLNDKQREGTVTKRDRGFSPR